MRKWAILISVMFCMLSGGRLCFAEEKPYSDSRKLQTEDMLMLVLLPQMQSKLVEAYEDILTEPPGLYPYFVDVTNVERIHDYRTFSFWITLEATPTVGPHIPVGKDRFIFKVSPNDIKLAHYEHLKGPIRINFPPNYEDIIKHQPLGMRKWGEALLKED